MTATQKKVVYRTCPLCEATCGLELHLEDREITLVRGDRDDVFSHGFLCPKGTALKGLEADPDRLRAPQVRRGDAWSEVSWDDAFAEVERGLTPILEQHGRDAVAVYLGNPNVHNLAGQMYNRVLLQALGTANIFSASTVDQMPKHVSSGLMFGGALSIPIADIDRTDYLLMLGANPFASNGSLMTAPDFPGRIRALRARGGKLVVVDPRRSKSAEEADEHLFIRPGTDAHFLFALAHTLFDEGLVALGRLEEHVNGFAEVQQLAKDFDPDTVAAICGIDADTIRRTARELAGAPHAAVYGRIGTCTQEYGTLASWLVDVCNVLTGNLDREGGAMFTKPAHGAANTGGTPGKGRGVRFGRRHSRVRGLPERFGELPVVCLAEEIQTPGEGQIRAMFTIAGNPVLSTPDSARLDRAVASLDFMVSVDIYRNETTRHANVILPPEGVLARGHYDIAFYTLAIRNIANYSPPSIELAPGEMSEWEILLRLAAIASGQGAAADPAALDDFVVAGLVDKAVGRGSNVEGRDSAELLESLSSRRGPERILDFMLRTGPYGDGFGADPDGLTLAALEAEPHGVDLGPLQPRVPEMLRTPSGKIELAPEPVVEDVARLRASLDRANGSSHVRGGDLASERAPAGRPALSRMARPAASEAMEMVLIGRRDLRSNNSWMHNVEILVKGKERCTLHLHPDDAARIGVVDGGQARVSSRTGEVEVVVEVTDAIMPGVVSIPHGWGHDANGAEMSVAARRPGVNSNVLADGELFDPLSGNAVLNGIPVRVAAAIPA
ncbi:MAG: molybdopterin-dependent oxidoreductase [Actinobacteria bacterium]|nr:molybdopterin-dependent oxidoreductase [Actinomycetota bacterium]